MNLTAIQRPLTELDMWMVRVTQITPQQTFSRYTAVNLDPADETPGVYPQIIESGRMLRSNTYEPWRATRDRIEAFVGWKAYDYAANVYDAARGFLALNLTPDGKYTDPVRPAPQLGQLRIEIGDHLWVFNEKTAPEAAVELLRSAADSNR